MSLTAEEKITDGSRKEIINGVEKKPTTARGRCHQRRRKKSPMQRERNHQRGGEEADDGAGKMSPTAEEKITDGSRKEIIDGVEK